MMDWDIALKIFGALISLATLNFGFYKWMDGRLQKSVDTRFSDHMTDDVRDHKAMSQEIESQGGRISTVETHVASVESDVRHLPNHGDVGKIYDRLDTVNGSVRELLGGQQSLSNQVSMLNEYLINKEKS